MSTRAELKYALYIELYLSATPTLVTRPQWIRHSSEESILRASALSSRYIRALYSRPGNQGRWSVHVRTIESPSARSRGLDHRQPSGAVHAMVIK